MADMWQRGITAWCKKDRDDARSLSLKILSSSENRKENSHYKQINEDIIEDEL